MADPLTSLTDPERAGALGRFQVLRRHLEDGIPLSSLAHSHMIPLRTLQRWLQHYRAHGLAGLTRTPRADRGQHRLAPELYQLIEGLALRTPPPTAAYVHRQVVAVTQAQGWSVPSYSTVYGIIRHLDPALVTLAQEGTKVYRETFDLLYRW
jgi:putative transposase